jgi:hypothetical protein
MQKEDGSMPPGWNGPYHQPETPVRNTSHWLITFLKAYEISGDIEYEDAAKKCVRYLLSEEARPMGATFWHRNSKRKDRCNGLIGQAWTIEALAIAGEKLHMPNCKDLAKEIFLLHPFDEKCGLWKRVDVDGKTLDYDYVFNHQLWFAACSALIDDGEVRERVSTFMNGLEKNMEVDETGLINHFLMPKCGIRSKVHNAIIRAYLLQKGKRYTRLLEEGYQSFNLYAFALLKEKIPDHAFWHSDKFISCLDYIKLSSYRNGLRDNRYGFPYNPVGFENAFAMHIFPRHFEEDAHPTQHWVSLQIEEHFDFEKGLMAKNTEDPITLSARIYEATRLPNIEI